MKREPCPFCGHGSTKVLYRRMRGATWMVECGHCHARGPLSFEGEQQATAEWNERSTPQREAIVLQFSRPAA